MVNETFAISLPERRTFFLEGTDLLNTDLDSIYTRSINSPLNALKFINQGDSTSSLIMHAIDEDSPYLAGGLYESYSGKDAFKQKLADLCSVVGMVAAPEETSDMLDYCLKGTLKDLISWGHEYLRALSGQIGDQYDKRVADGTATEDLA